MYTIMIVDDEPLMRIGIKSCVPWEKYGFEVVGQAEDGKKAAELVERLRPDIVITDIKMPHMDGIGLIRYLHERYPQTKSIVLSCYNEFEYVRQALKMGAEDYILKLSMDPDALIKILLKAKKSIEEERARDVERNTIDRELWKNRYLIREDQIRKLLTGSISVGRFLEMRPGFAGHVREYRVLCCEIDHYREAMVRSQLKDRYLFKFSLLNILEECILGSCKGEIVELEENCFVAILWQDSQPEKESILRCAEPLCAKINNVLKLYLNITASFGVSEIFSELDQLLEQTEYARLALQNKFFKGIAGTHFYMEEMRFEDRLLTLTSQEEQRLCANLDLLNQEGAEDILAQFLDKLCLKPLCSPDCARRSIRGVVHLLLRHIYREEALLAKQDRQELSKMLEESVCLDTLDDAKKLLRLFTSKTIQKLKALQKESGRWEITKIKAYACQHIDEDITLEKAAGICNISKSYFSSIFKRETGEGFTDYLNRIKMEHARQLIREQGYKVYEAAFAVGISDESYFSKLFKKYTGQSPSAIRLGSTQK